MKTRSSRQSFLGANSDDILQSLTVAVVGVSGGGSPIAQQLSHIGFGTTHLIDAAHAQEHHRHRLIGVSSSAIKHKWSKPKVLKRLMKRVNPEGAVHVHEHPWQKVHEVLRDCDLVFSCMDGYLAREELERYLRRFEVPMIDVGMDVLKCPSGYSICGQVIASIPGKLCMRCFGFIRDELLAQEALQYGAAGVNPQVVWPNGVLASTAVALAMGMVLPWNEQLSHAPYLVYDGNRMVITPSPRLQYLEGLVCPHYPVSYPSLVAA